MEAIRITASKIGAGEIISRPIPFVSQTINKLRSQGFGAGPPAGKAAPGGVDAFGRKRLDMSKITITESPPEAWK